jgi:serine protease AprX
MKRLLTLVFVCMSLPVVSQPNRYFVFFKDKNNSVFSVSDPVKFLTQKSLDRRTKGGIAIVPDDLPVNASYVSQIRLLGVKTYFTSKWWNGVLIQADQSIIPAINALPFVVNTEFVAPGAILQGGRTGTRDKSNQPDAVAQQSDFQLQQLAMDKMQEEGYRGEGVTIAQFDSGWQGVNLTAPFQPLFLEGRIKGVFNFVRNTSNVYSDDNHGTEVLSVMAAYVPGTFAGGTYKANYYLFETEDDATEYRIEEYNWAFAAEKADSLGVDVINSSLGYSTFDDPSMNYTIFDLTGKKAVVSITARKAVEKGMVVACSAGNEGNNNFWKFVATPADADGVLAVGSITSIGNKSSFSSIGPTADQRLKPDVVALGSGTAVISATGSLSSASGTSLASPLVASLAAGLIQAFPNKPASEITQAIIQSGSLFSTPNNSLGHGIPNFEIAKSYLKYGVLEEDISVFPNPVSKSLNILLKAPSNGLITVSVYSLLGQQIFQQSTAVGWETNPIQYDLSLLANGIYLLEVKSDKETLVKKIAKTD